jgi:hypothetical protein
VVRRAVELAQRKQLHCVTTNIFAAAATGSTNCSTQGQRFLSVPLAPAPSFRHGNVHAVRREKFRELGGFHEQVAFAEDYLLSQQVERKRFGIVRGGVYTTNRRFQKMGHLRVGWLFLKTAMNYWNPTISCAITSTGRPSLQPITSLGLSAIFRGGHKKQDPANQPDPVLFSAEPCAAFSKAHHNARRQTNVILRGPEEAGLHVVSLESPCNRADDFVIEAAAQRRSKGCPNRKLRSVMLELIVHPPPPCGQTAGKFCDP